MALKRFNINVHAREFHLGYYARINVPEHYQIKDTEIFQVSDDYEIQSVKFTDETGIARVINWDYVWNVDVIEVDEDGNQVKQ